MPEWNERTELLLGVEAAARLAESNVLVVGLGGVGAYAAELLARAGVGRMTVVDGDVVSATNRNRQLPALLSTENQPKATLMTERLKLINPELKVKSIIEFLSGDRIPEILSGGFDFMIDAIDVLSDKVSLIVAALDSGTPLVSSMGAGAKMDPSAVAVDDIEKSHTCPLAKMVRKRLHNRGIRGGFPVVFSSEPAKQEAIRRNADDQNYAKTALPLTTVGSISYMPAVFGAFCASVAIRELQKNSTK